MSTFREHIQRGTRMAFVYHVAGMDWAVTNDAEFAEFVNSGDGAGLRTYLYGAPSNGYAYSKDEVHTLVALDPNLGSQTVSASKEGGIDVGAWSVRSSGEASGYKFGALFQGSLEWPWFSGFPGLDWQPDETISGVKHAFLSRDLIVSRNTDTLGECDLYWSKYTGNGLKKWIDDNANPPETAGAYLWIGSGCLCTAGAVEEVGTSYKVPCIAGQFNAPLEDLIYQEDLRYRITNVPQGVTGMTARLFAVPVQVVDGVFELADPAYRPFLLRTGKVQQNASYAAGMWTLQHCGFTGQMKYKGSVGAFSAQIAGYTFTRYTPVNNTIFNAQRNAQMPHLWVSEYSRNTNGGTRRWPNGDNVGGWAPSAGSSGVSSELLDGNPSIRSAALSGAKPGMRLDGAILSNKTYSVSARLYVSYYDGVTGFAPITITRGSGGLWQKVVSASTGQYINAQFTISPRAGDTYLDILYDAAATVGSGYISIVDLEIKEINTLPLEVWLCDAGDGVHFDTLEELKNAAVAALNAASSLGYTLDSEGDIVCESDDHAVFMSGPVPYVCGWGYRNIWTAETAPLPWLENPGQQMFFSGRRALQWPPNSKPVYYFEDDSGNTGPTANNGLAIRSAGDSVGKFWHSSISGLYESGALPKNHSTHAYYYQCPIDATVMHAGWRELADNGIHYFQSGGIPIQQGDLISIGPARGRLITDGEPSENGAVYIAIEGKKTEALDEYFSGVMWGMPATLQWMVGWFDYYANNEGELPEGTILTSKDPYPITRQNKASKDLPGKLFREMLGQPKDDGTRGDVPISMMATTIADLFGYTASDRRLINFDALDDAVSGFGLFGAEYTAEPPKADTEGTSEQQETDVLKMLQAVCTTHGVTMIWRYDDTQRSWILDFVPERSATLADTVLQSRVIDQAVATIDEITEINGGQFSFAGVKAKYLQKNGVERDISVSDPAGKAQHANGGKKLELEDKITRLDHMDTQGVDKLIAYFGAKILHLSNVYRGVNITGSLESAGFVQVGEAVAVDLRHLRDPQTGRQSNELKAATVAQMQTTIGATEAACRMTAHMSRLALSGISPSLYVSLYTKSGANVAVTVLATNPAGNVFASSAGGLTDLATFGCYAYSPERGIYKRDCGCGPYACLIVERGVNAIEWLVNMWPCTIDVSAANIAAGTATIILTDGAAAFPDDDTSGKRFVLIFAPRDSAGLQPCQTSIYGWLGNDADVTTDSDGGEHTPAMVGQ